MSKNGIQDIDFNPGGAASTYGERKFWGFVKNLYFHGPPGDFLWTHNHSVAHIQRKIIDQR